VNLPQLDLLYEEKNATSFPLPAELRAAYGGDLGFPSPRVFANFVSSVDGVVALEERAESGGIISSGDQGDRFVMGLLRACADGVLVGAGTFRKAGPHLWYPDRIFPEGAQAWAELRRNLGLAERPRLVLLSASGDVDPAHPALRDGAIVIVSPRGEPRLRGRLPAGARLAVVEEDPISFAKVLAIARGEGLQLLLTEGGPTLAGRLLAENLLDELFLTTSPLLLGRHGGDNRKSLVDGVDLRAAGTGKLALASVRQRGSFLYLRYSLARS
jgi:riboflavin biosynthesis pyrimidine reductase